MTVNDFFQWGLPALLTGLLLIVAFFMRRIIEDVDRLDQDAQDCAIQHERHRSHVAENYAKRTDVQHSLDRIHSRLDALPGEIIRAIRKGE
jgi:hypothetical protein